MPVKLGAEHFKQAIKKLSETLEMSDVRSTDKIILASIGDLHLTIDPPAFRSQEKNWLETQAGYLRQVKQILTAYGNPQLICTGDIFDDGWRERKCPPELINMALDCLPDGMLCVAGNHDLPNHRMDGIFRSAYWTLVQAEKIRHMDARTRYPVDYRTGLGAYGFSWGETVCTYPQDKNPKIAVLHAYVWKDGHCFPGVKQEDHVHEWVDRLFGFNAAVFGDNHKAFVHGDVLNGGAFMRRRSDEADHRPFVGLLTDKFQWRRHYLDVSQDVTFEKAGKDVMKKAVEFADFLEELNKLGDSALDFAAAVNELMETRRVSSHVKLLVAKCIGG